MTKKKLSRKFNKALRDEMQAALDSWDRKAMAVLIERGADVNQTDRSGHSPIEIAAINGDFALAQLLLGKGADFKAVRPTKLSALTVSVTNNHLDILRLLADAGADLGMRDGCGLTAMDWAKDKDFGSAEKVKTLQDIIEGCNRRDTEKLEKSRRDAFNLRQETLKDTARRRRPRILP